MTTLRIVGGSYEFTGRLHDEEAPRTCDAFRTMLPLRGQIIHARWSGEACWVPLGDLDLQVPLENQTAYPAPGHVLLYTGNLSETEILVPYGGCAFSSVAGQLAGSHFLTIDEGRHDLRALGEACLWHGAQEFTIERTS